MHYFSTFPLVGYSVNSGPVTAAINITKRFTVNQLLKNSVITYYTYSIKDGDRPDTVALKFYKDSRLDWLVLMTNETHDPYYSWPMDYVSLSQFMIKKYGSISTAMATTHHYEQVISEKSITTDKYGETILIPDITIVVDQTTYTALAAAERNLVTVYDYETNLNDQHRILSLIDPIQLTGIIKRYKELFE